MLSSLRSLCLVTAVLCNVYGSLEHEIPRRSFLSRRAIDGTRGRKLFDPQEEGAFDSFGSAGGQYDPYEEKTDLSDIRRNVPGEPGVDYPAHTTLPQTGFTCEGRSRGYYADEVAGCQVFHVCHDVLVSSFLCPIGSIFSQKLLTCDWWTKVDCATTQKYVDVNRNSYQQDDDEMIRNAYAMVSLQSGKDVTKDGLVDPDRTGSIIDYQRGIANIVDYSTADTAGNDLKNGFDDYLTAGIRQFVPNYGHTQRQPESPRRYQDKYRVQEKSRSPYHDSPIIRIQNIEDDRRDYVEQSKKSQFQESYRRPNEFTNQFQPSYAPTVPTVTTTTRRFYSPTIPTTYRPSTLAYSKLDQLVESSNRYYTQTKIRSFVTPPTRVFPNEDIRAQDSSDIEDGLKRSEVLPDRVEEDYEEGESYEDVDEDVKSIRQQNEASKPKFEVRVADDYQFGRNHSQQDRNPIVDRIYRQYERKAQDEENLEDIEVRGSIGLGHALRQPRRRISVQEQDPVDSKTKNVDVNSRRHKSRLPSSRHSTALKNEEVAGDYQHTLTKPQSVASFARTEEDTTEQYDRDAAATTTIVYDSREYLINTDSRATSSKEQESTEKESNDDPNIFVPSTTPSYVESTIDATTRSSSTIRSISDFLFGGENYTQENSTSVNFGPRSFDEGSISRIDRGPPVPRPTEFLKPPNSAQNRFRINVPDTPTPVTSLLTRYSTIGDGTYSEISSTEIPRLHGAIVEENLGKATTFGGNSGTTILENNSGFSSYPTTRVRFEGSSAAPWFTSSFADRSVSNIPVTEIVPPIVDYNDGFGDFVAPDEEKSTTLPPLAEEPGQLNLSSFLKNDTEKEILGRYNSEFQFTIRDAIRSDVNSKAPCTSASFDESGGPCTTTTVYDKIFTSTPIPLARTIFDSVNEATTKSSVLPQFANTTPRPITVTVTPSFEEFSTVATNVESLRSTTVTSKDDQTSNHRSKESRNNERPVVSSTPDSLFQSLRPETLKQIEESIEKNNSPYQVSLTVSKDEELVSIGDDVISRLIAQQGKATSTVDDKLDSFEVIKSVAPETQATSDMSMSAMNVSETRTQPRYQIFSDAPIGNFSIFEPDPSVNSKRLDTNASTVSLLQLMAELLKLDRLPRPFAHADAQNSDIGAHSDPPSINPISTTQKSSLVRLDRLQTRTVPRDVNINVHFADNPTVTSQNTFASPAEKTIRPPSKEQLLEQLKRNFGQPLYGADRFASFDLPNVRRVLDFQTGLPLQKSQYAESELEDSAKEIVSTASSLSTTVRVTSTTERTTTTTAAPKAIVKTEFVPSIGFSFDTDEGREEYVEAVLGGLIDVHGDEGERKDQTTIETTRTFSRNETSGAV